MRSDQRKASVSVPKAEMELHPEEVQLIRLQGAKRR